METPLYLAHQLATAQFPLHHGMFQVDLPGHSILTTLFLVRWHSWGDRRLAVRLILTGHHLMGWEITVEHTTLS